GQLLVDVQRSLPDARQAQPDEQRGAREHRRRKEEPVRGLRQGAARPVSASACTSGGSGAARHGCSSSTSGAWYTRPALTSQMSWCAPARRLSAARIAVSIEWSELL